VGRLALRRTLPGGVGIPGPVVEDLREPAEEAARGREDASATIARSAVHVRTVSTSTASRLGRPSGATGSPMRTRIRRRNFSHEFPLIATGMIGNPERSAKYAVPSWSGVISDSWMWILPSPAIARTPPAANTASTRRTVSSRSFLPGLKGTDAPVQDISLLRPPVDMSSSLGPKKKSRGRSGRTVMRMNGSVQPRWLKQ